MAHRLHRGIGISRCIVRYLASGCQLQSGTFSNSAFKQRSVERSRYSLLSNFVQRYALSSEVCQDLHPHREFLTFIRTTFSELDGSNHRWFNCKKGSKGYFSGDETFLLLACASAESFALLGWRERISISNKLKIIQQRYPQLNVFILLYGSPVNSAATRAHIIQFIMEEYIKFPILVSDRDFTEIKNSVSYLVFEGSNSNLCHLDVNSDLESIATAVEKLSMLQNDTGLTERKTSSNMTKQLEIAKGPYLNPFRNLLLQCPGCLSVDDDGDRIFISDGNHHRIIICDSRGRLLDSIGSSPGFQDGEFEEAKLLRPAASFYHSRENCLYIVDSENHAIRKADLERRVLDTLYPFYNQKKHGFWNSILGKLGLASEVTITHREELDLNLIKFPWHLLYKEENDLLIIDRSFETSWLLCIDTGEIKKIIEGSSSIVDVYGQTLLNKVAPINSIPKNLLPKGFGFCLSFQGIPCAGLISSIANFQNYIIFSDAVGHKVLRFDKDSSAMSYLQFSKLAILGLPYWMACPVERFPTSGVEIETEHVRHLNVLPGKCIVQVLVNIPKGTELVGPLDKGCILRQARGSGAELSGPKESITKKQKVGMTQLWYDELDGLAFEKPEDESTEDEGLEGVSFQDNVGIAQQRYDESDNLPFKGPVDEPIADEGLKGVSSQDKEKVHFDCEVGISPGTCEVVVSAILYLKLKKLHHNDAEQWSTITKLLDFDKESGIIDDGDDCIKLLLESCENIGQMIFMKPLQLRLRLNCSDYPTAANKNEIILTNSKVNVDISL